MYFKVLAIAALVSAPLAVGATTIDFDHLDSSPTQSLLTNFSEDGFTFRVKYQTGGTSPGVAVFDTNCVTLGIACNGDEDLVPATQGENGIQDNVLILQEPNPASKPDDDLFGGKIKLELRSGPKFRFVGASAIDDGTFTFRTSVDSDRLGRLILGSDTETGMASFRSSILGIGDSIIIQFSGSGAIDSLVLEAVAPVPVPASLPLLLAGIAGFGVLARRRRPT